jgi:hypothetical protein
MAASPMLAIETRDFTRGLPIYCAFFYVCSLIARFLALSDAQLCF